MTDNNFIFFVIIIILLIKIIKNNHYANTESFEQSNNISDKINNVVALIKRLKQPNEKLIFNKKVNLSGQLNGRQIIFKNNVESILPIGSIVPYYGYDYKLYSEGITELIRMKQGDENINYNTIDGDNTNKKLTNIVNLILTLQGRENLLITEYKPKEHSNILEINRYDNEIIENTQRNREELDKNIMIFNYYVNLYRMEQNLNNINVLNLKLPKNYVLCNGKYYKKFLELNDNEDNNGIDSLELIEEEEKLKYVKTPNLINKTVFGLDINIDLAKNDYTEFHKNKIDEQLNKYRKETINDQVMLDESQLGKHNHKLWFDKKAIDKYKFINNSSDYIKYRNYYISDKFHSGNDWGYEMGKHMGNIEEDVEQEDEENTNKDNKQEIQPDISNTSSYLNDEEITLIFRGDILYNYFNKLENIKEAFKNGTTDIYDIILLEDGKSLKSRLYNDFDFRINFISTINIQNNFINFIINCYNNLFDNKVTNKIFPLKIKIVSIMNMDFNVKYSLNNITIGEFMNGKVPIKINNILKSKLNDSSLTNEIIDFIKKYIIDKKIPMLGYNDNSPMLKITQDNVLDILLIGNKFKNNLEKHMESYIDSNAESFKELLENVSYKNIYFKEFIRTFIQVDNKDYYMANTSLFKEVYEKIPLFNIKVNLSKKSYSEVLNVFIVQKLFILNKNKMFNELEWDKNEDFNMNGEIFKLLLVPSNHEIPEPQNIVYSYDSIYQKIFFSNVHFVNNEKKISNNFEFAYQTLNYSLFIENKNQTPLHLIPPNKKLLYLMKI